MTDMYSNNVCNMSNNNDSRGSSSGNSDMAFVSAKVSSSDGSKRTLQESIVVMDKGSETGSVNGKKGSGIGFGVKNGKDNGGKKSTSSRTTSSMDVEEESDDDDENDDESDNEENLYSEEQDRY